ncbi:methyltransferase [Halomonas halocynthiae]|uniref:methyltransferase n=1 Tax=Halomonas halocynthiae TaxID=176290 RepID=UPI000428D57D|nr:methyltransferase [Halomonas halocynthiae]
MSAETPVCQLLERQPAGYHGWLWVAPPQDAWLEQGQNILLSADEAILNAWRERGRKTASPLNKTLGESVLAPPGVVVFWPKAHALGEWWLLWLCAHLKPGTPLQVVGENQGGIKRVLKVLAALGLGCQRLDNARRCSLFGSALERVALEPDAVWKHFDAEGLTLASHPGVFGHGKLDDGTRMLLAHLPNELVEVTSKGCDVLDMGCGDGIIATWLAKRGHRVCAVDVNGFAVEATRRSLAANGLDGEVLAGDVYSSLGERRFDVIVSNPPFHQERSIDHGPASRLIRDAPMHLRSGGSLILVANAFLPWPRLLSEAFGDVEILADDRRYRVYRAIRR